MLLKPVLARFHRPVVGLIAMLLYSFSFPSLADSVDELSKRLVEMRAEVDSLNNDLSLLRAEHKEKMKYVQAQKGELESQLRRDQQSVDRLQAKLDKHRQQIREQGASAEFLKPVVLNQIAILRQSILDGIPFKRKDRLASLSDLETQVSTDAVSPQRAVNRLWAFVEDEIRLSRENGIYQQTIELDGEEVLAEVAKLGLVAMYFKTGEGVVGKLTGAPGQWQYQVLADGNDVKQVESLFDSLKKQIRSGYFALPNALVMNKGL